MNLCRLLIAVSIIFPKHPHETTLHYNYRVLMVAATAIKAVEMYKSTGKHNTSGSDLKINDVLQKYRTLSKTLYAASSLR